MFEWREDLKKILLQAGLKNKPMVFLFVDTQIINEACNHLMGFLSSSVSND